ncbi:MAG: hypothetical protein ABIO24_11655 [Saprospiraceae bacterium]
MGKGFKKNGLIPWRLLVYFLLLFPALPLVAQADATASLQPERIETGDTFQLRILISGTSVEPGTVDFGPWAALLPAKNILSRSGWHRSGPQWVQNFTLVTFDSAILDLPALSVRLHLGETARTNPLRLTVVPTPAEADVNTMASIRDIERSPSGLLDYWPWALAGLILLIVLNRLFRRKKIAVPLVVAAPLEALPPPVHAEALQKITRLERKRLWEKDQVKEHYAELSLIVREYLEKRYGIPAMESTTMEIEKLLKTTDFPKTLNLAIQDLLSKADLAKYAQSSPPAAFHEKAIEKARAMIQETKSA